MHALKFFIFTAFVHIAIASFGQVVNGRFDAKLLEENNYVALSGDWEFYPGQLLRNEDFETYPARSPQYILVPGTWNSQDISGKGFATYRIKLKNLPVDKLLSISVPNVYSSYNLFFEDELIASNGTVGTSKESYTPQWLMQTVTIKPETKEADLIFQVANFHHFRGGIHKKILFGDHKALHDQRENELMAQMMLFSGLIVLGIFFLSLFLIRAKNDYQPFLFFSLFCMTWAGRVFFAHIYLRSFFMPDMNWSIAIKSEYVLLYLSLVFGILFINKVFSLGKTMGFRLMMIINLIFILITTFLSAEIFTALLQVYLVLAVGNFIYIFYAIVKAIFKKRTGAWIAGLSVIFALMIFIYEILAYQMEWSIDHMLLQTVYLIVFILNSFILAHGFVMQERKIEAMEEKQYHFLKTGA